MKYEEIIKNKKLSMFADFKESVINSYIKNVPKNIPKCKSDKQKTL